MDPDETLTQIRKLIVAWQATEDTGDATSILEDLSGLVESLDQWLASGGFLPTRWHPAYTPTRTA